MSVEPLNNPNNVRNIPHMLRNLAAELEAGAERMPESLILVAVYGPGEVPEHYQFGRDDRTLVDAAALMLTAQRMMALTLAKEEGR